MNDVDPIAHAILAAKDWLPTDAFYADAAAELAPVVARIRTIIATEERAKCLAFVQSYVDDCEHDAASGDHPDIADDLRIQADLLRGVIEKIEALP